MLDDDDDDDLLAPKGRFPIIKDPRIIIIIIIARLETFFFVLSTSFSYALHPTNTTMLLDPLFEKERRSNKYGV